MASDLDYDIRGLLSEARGIFLIIFNQCYLIGIVVVMQFQFLY